MKSVLISIQPKWVEKIVNGSKTIEVRKTIPNINEPFKCYIYCTKGTRAEEDKYGYIGQQKVIGEFICDKVEEYKHLTGNICYYDIKHDKVMEESCLTYKEFATYGNRKTLYGWHISNLKIYDKPKELNIFRKETHIKGNNLHQEIESAIFNAFIGSRISRPPQSWCYIEDLGE